MEDQLIGYLLDALDEKTKAEVEAYIARHPEAREKLALLKQAMEPLEADFTAAPPPPLLAERTLATVAEYICDPDKLPDDLPQAPPISPAAVRAGRSWWRRADVLVAASIMLTILGVGTIILARMQSPSSDSVIVQCKHNMLHFYLAMETYRDTHGKFPDISSEKERGVAGMFVPILIDAGTLSSNASIRCPGIGPPLSCQLSLSELRTMSLDDFDKRSPCLSMCYAYSLGYRDEAGNYRPPGDVPNGLSQLPMMADRPPAEGVLRNSFNHGDDRYSGQNVLFADGHVRFLVERAFCPGDDIFLNRKNYVSAGLDVSDIVLGYSSARP